MGNVNYMKSNCKTNLTTTGNIYMYKGIQHYNLSKLGKKITKLNVLAVTFTVSFNRMNKAHIYSTVERESCEVMVFKHDEIINIMSESTLFKFVFFWGGGG